MNSNIRKALFEPLVAGDLRVIVPQLTVEIGESPVTVPAVLSCKGGGDFEFTLHFPTPETPAVFNHIGGRTMGEEDRIPISGLIEGEIPFRALIYPAGPRTHHSRGTSTLTIETGRLDFPPEGGDESSTNEIRRLLGMDPLPDEESERKFSAHLIFHGPELHLLDSGTEVVRTNDFLGEASTSTFDTHQFGGEGWKAALIQSGKELHLHVRNNETSTTRIPNPVELIDRIADAVAFTHGFQPWPVYREIRQDHRIVENWLSTHLDLRQTNLAPVSRRLGSSLRADSTSELVNIIPTITEGLGILSAEQRSQIKTLLWHVRTSATAELPPTAKLLIVCSALDGLMKVIAGDMGSGRTMDEWREAARLSALDWQGYLLPIMEIRKRHRDHLSHGRLWTLEDAPPDVHFTDYPRLGCAFMTIIAALCGYNGPIVTHPFEGERRNVSSFQHSTASSIRHDEKD